MIAYKGHCVLSTYPEGIESNHTHLCRLRGVLLISAVGTSCSPGRIHKIGPSFDSRRSICTIDNSPHSIACKSEKNPFKFSKLFNPFANPYLIEEWILFETFQKIGEIASDFFVNLSHQTDLV